MSFSAPTPSVPAAPAAPSPAPIYGEKPVQGKPKRKSMQTSFLGTGDIPQQNAGTKTLLGV